jgi:hypothetical protein
VGMLPHVGRVVWEAGARRGRRSRTCSPRCRWASGGLGGSGPDGALPGARPAVPRVAR